MSKQYNPMDEIEFWWGIDEWDDLEELMDIKPEWCSEDEEEEIRLWMLRGEDV